MATGNAFGKDIEFREGAPVQLLRYVEGEEGFGKIVLNPEALSVLQTIRELANERRIS